MRSATPSLITSSAVNQTSLGDKSLVLTLLEAKKVISLKEQNDAGDSFSLTAGSVGRKVTHFQKIATHNG